MLWHLLQVSDVLDQEFGSALSQFDQVIAWQPVRTLSPWKALRPGGEAAALHEDPPVPLRTFPLLRGFSRFPLSYLPSMDILLKRLLRQSPHPARSPLLLTVPFFAPPAEKWPGPVIYWLTDLLTEYVSTDRRQVESLDRRLCAVATLVCPNSARIADYLVSRAGCDRTKIHILPNATRAANLLPHPPVGPAALPDDVANLPRPIAGVIGNLAGNMDWQLLSPLIEQAPQLSWLFVGPTTMPIADGQQSAARSAALHNPRAHFTGPRPYGALASYARSFDVAILPYRRMEPTFSGSSTRFYEHLAACRPMLATRGFEELLHKEPLLTLFDTAAEGAGALQTLAGQGFEDQHIRARWNASRESTWEARALTLRGALNERWRFQ